MVSIGCMMPSAINPVICEEELREGREEVSESGERR